MAAIKGNMKPGQGFQKGNKYAGQKPKGKKELSGIQEYLEYLASGAARSYYQYLQDQFAGKEISKEVKEAMDRFEKNTEFVAPKLSRRELTGKDGDALIPKPIYGGKSKTE